MNEAAIVYAMYARLRRSEAMRVGEIVIPLESALVYGLVVAFANRS